MKKNRINNILYFMHKMLTEKKITIFYMLVVTIAIAVTPFIHIIFPKLILDSLFDSKINEFQIILYISIYAVTAVLLGIATIYLKSVFEVNVKRFQNSISRQHVKKCMSVPFQNTENTDFLNFAWKTKRTIETRIARFINSMPDFIAKFISLIGYMMIIVVFDYRVLLLLLANIVIIFLLTNKVKMFELKKIDEITEVSRKAQYYYDTIFDFSYGKDIRLFNIKNILSSKFLKHRKITQILQKEISKKYFLIDIINTFFVFIRDAVVLYYLILLVINRQISVGSIFLYFSSIGGFTIMVQNILSDISSKIQDSQLLYEVKEFFDYIEVEQNSDNVVDKKIESYSIKFINVNFRYPNQKQFILNNFNLIINSGESVAIVGLNGAGKTTIVKLLCKLYEAESGSILINDKNINDIAFGEVVSLISPIFQDFALFAFSIRENITMDVSKIEEERLIKVLQDMNLYTKINLLDKKLETSVSKELDPEGIDFSGGEKQSIALARCLYKNSEIVILDEPMASFDALMEDKIYNMFQELARGKTAIFISHRLASTKFCDKIAYIENGKVMEFGTHDELLTQNGLYAKLFQLQASYYKNESEITYI